MKKIKEIFREGLGEFFFIILLYGLIYFAVLYGSTWMEVYLEQWETIRVN